MAQYQVKDNLSGKTITFEWSGEGEPTEKDMTDIVSEATNQKEKVVENKSKMFYNRYGKPMVEFGGMAAGAAVGAKTGALIGAPGGPPGMAIGGALGGLVGGAFGYGMAKKGSDIATGEAKGGVEGLEQSAKDLKTGALMQGGGQVAGPIISGAIKGVGGIIKPIWGRLMGTGKAVVEEMIKSGTDTGLSMNPLKTVTQFDKAMRGELTGQDIVENAHAALSKIKEARGATYVAQLEKVKANPKELDAVKQRLDQTMEQLSSSDRFTIQQMTEQDGSISFDFSNSTIIKGRAIVRQALEDVTGWTDNTAKGLDVLKKRLSTYIDQVPRETPARSLLTGMEKTLDAGLKESIPGYREMTKGYAEATKLIKDVESGLMMRESGISGRITADQTLRRLMSAMKDNFELRTDLVKVLGSKGSQDLMGEVAGHTASSIVPRDLAGTGPAMLVNVALAHFVNPSFWPVLAASSPRISGEFLRMFGKFATEATGTAPTLGALGAYAVGKEEQE